MMKNDTLEILNHQRCTGGMRAKIPSQSVSFRLFLGPGLGETGDDLWNPLLGKGALASICRIEHKKWTRIDGKEVGR